MNWNNCKQASFTVTALACALVALADPRSARATTDKERGFAVCLFIVPGTGAASLGYPLRGALTFGVGLAGSTLILSETRTAARELRPVDDGVMAAGLGLIGASYLWALIDGATLESATDLLPPPTPARGWRPDPKPHITPPHMVPFSGAPPQPPKPEPTPQPKVSGRAIIETKRGGVQEVTIGERVEVRLIGGGIVQGELVEVSGVSVVVQDDTGTRRKIQAPDIARIFLLRRE